MKNRDIFIMQNLSLAAAERAYFRIMKYLLSKGCSKSNLNSIEFGTKRFMKPCTFKSIIQSSEANKGWFESPKFMINKRDIKSNEYQLIDNFKKGNEEWNKLPCDIWFYILHEFFDTDYDQTNKLIKLSKVTKLFYEKLLSSELIMNNFAFSLKKGVKLNEIKPSYKIKNLSLIYVRNGITNKDLKCLTNENYFDLYKLDISFCNLLNDESFQYFSSVKVLELVACDQDETSNKGLGKLTNLKELNMIACDQKTITDDIFKSIGKDLVKLNISCCYQFTNEIFNYLPHNCKIKMNKLNLKRD
jgi:hypothetical protein